tara:strand:+ start:174 stop:662 length:489 start_codon:yes stop_codon:yes gene_type:complete
MAVYTPNLTEVGLHHFYEDERITLSGQGGEYYTVNRARNVDPLYNEPTINRQNEWGFEPLFNAIFAIEFETAENITPEVQERGYSEEGDSKITVSYLEWQRKCPDLVKYPHPKEGDIVYLMDRYWDIVKAKDKGRLLHSNTPSGYVIEGRLRTKHLPQRRLP